MSTRDFRSTRRQFLQGGAAGAALSTVARPLAAQQPPVPLEEYQAEYFDAAEWAFVMAATARLIPTEGDGWKPAFRHSSTARWRASLVARQHGIWKVRTCRMPRRWTRNCAISSACCFRTPRKAILPIPGMAAWVHIGFPGGRASLLEWTDPSKDNVPYPLGPVSIAGGRA